MDGRLGQLEQLGQHLQMAAVAAPAIGKLCLVLQHRSLAAGKLAALARTA